MYVGKKRENDFIKPMFDAFNAAGSLQRGGAFDSAKNHKRQSVTAKREKSQTPKFV